jgi:hypothetical protein
MVLAWLRLRQERRGRWNTRRRRARRRVAEHVDWCQTIGTEKESAARGLHQPLQTRPHLPCKVLCKQRDATAGVSEKREHQVVPCVCRVVCKPLARGMSKAPLSATGEVEVRSSSSLSLALHNAWGGMGEGEFVRNTGAILLRKVWSPASSTTEETVTFP